MENNNPRNLRNELNQLMYEADSFFTSFSKLDQEVYTEGNIPLKYKELTGLSISIVTHCNECIAYHIDQCLALNVSKDELLEAIKIGVVAGGSVTFPQARYAFSILREKEII